MSPIRPACHLLVACLLTAAPALAQTAPATPGQVAAPAADAPRPTLVKRDDQGNLIRVDVPIEYAALAALPLSETERSKIAPILTAHEQNVDGALRHATANIARVARVVEENNNAEIQGKLNELDDSAPMLRNRSAFRKDLTDAMTPENAAMFAGIMREYMQQAAQQAQREAQAQNRKGQLGLMAIGEARRVAAMDVRASLHRMAAKAWPTIADTIKASGISPANITAMQTRIDERKAAMTESSTDRDKADAFMLALGAISDDQQRLVVDALYKQHAPDMPPMKKVEPPVPEAEPGRRTTPANEPVLQPR